MTYASDGRPASRCCARPGPAARADWTLRHDLIGATPFWLAARFREPEIMRILAEHGADRDWLPSTIPATGTPAPPRCSVIWGRPTRARLNRQPLRNSRGPASNTATPA